MIVLYILLAILVLCFIVTAHEFGHFIVGRLCGIGVTEFSVGFGPKIVQWHGKKTIYSIRCIPLGGYCRFKGEDEENDAPDAMNNQKVWKRFLTVLAGPVMNFVLGFVMTVLLVMCFGVQDIVPSVGAVASGMPAESAGLMPGDVFEEVNGVKIAYDETGCEAMRAELQNAQDGDVLVSVRRGDERLTLTIPVQTLEDGTRQVGINFGSAVEYLSPIDSISFSAQRVALTAKLMVTSLRDLVFKGEGADEMMGAVGIVDYMSTTMQRGMDTIITFVILISLNLGIINLLPLPALDGGRLLFLLAEGIRRKPVSPEKEGMVHLIGFGLLLVLAVVITYKDIMRIVSRIAAG